MRSPFENLNARTMRNDRLAEFTAQFWAWAYPITIGLAFAFAVAMTFEQVTRG